MSFRVLVSVFDWKASLRSCENLPDDFEIHTNEQERTGNDQSAPRNSPASRLQIPLATGDYVASKVRMVLAGFLRDIYIITIKTTILAIATHFTPIGVIAITPISYVLKNLFVAVGYIEPPTKARKQRLR